MQPKVPSRDFSGLLPKEDQTAWMRPYRERAKARLFKFQPVTVEDRFAGFKIIHFQPHGLYMPTDAEMAAVIDGRLKEIGRWDQEDDRLKAYVALQEETEQSYRDGVPGAWFGQQAIARSLARWRIAAYGRRAGKTVYAAAEALSIALVRPRSTIWLAAPIAKLSGRAFDYVLQFLQDCGMLDDCRVQNQDQSKNVWLPNGSHIEGISCENVFSMAGAAVDFCVLDEAAQVTPDAWIRGILPPLMDRDGGALLISSYEGEGDFFSEKVLEVQAELEKAKAQGRDDFVPDWELFQGASYDLNFYAFPKGIDSDALVAARKQMPVVDFREQFGASVAGARERVFPEFKERVHVGNYPFNPTKPVRLCCDPSSGANPYAVLAVQDYGDYVIAIDELYERSTKAEDYDPIMRRKPWAANVVDMVVDSAWPHDIQRWNALGWKAFAVKKPGIEQSLPVVANLLRNSKLYDDFYQARVRYFLAKAGYDPNNLDHLPADDMKVVLYQVEESLGDMNLTDADITELKEAAQLFVSRTCVHFIHELKSYHYRKRRNLNVNFQEKPQDHDNHLIDAFRYWAWTFKRWAEHDHPKLRSLMTYAGPQEAVEGEEVPLLDFAQAQGRLWLEAQRARHSAERSATRSYLRRTA